MTIIVILKNKEKLGSGRRVFVRKEHHNKDRDYRNEDTIIEPQEQHEFTLWGQWTLTVKEYEP